MGLFLGGASSGTDGAVALITGYSRAGVAVVPSAAAGGGTLGHRHWS